MLKLATGTALDRRSLKPSDVELDLRAADAGMTPALAASVSNKLWSMDDPAILVDEYHAVRPRQKPKTAPPAAE